MARDIEEVVSVALKGYAIRAVKPGGRYAFRVDLREYGRHSLLHFGYKHQDTHPHKLELLDTGKMKFSEMLEEIGSVFHVDPLSLPIMRVDFAVDIPNVPVSWFREQVRVRHKQFAASVSEMQESEMGRGELQTLYLGKRPNCFRIYNKLREQEKQYQTYLSSYWKEYRRVYRKEWATNRCIPQLPPPMTYAEMFPPIEDKILTRVERQISRDRLPKQISTVASLQNLKDFNPFEPIEFSEASGSPIPSVEEVGLNRHVTGLGYRQLYKQLGEHGFRSALNMHSAGNGARIVREYGDFIYADTKRMITSDALYSKFQTSLQEQLTA